MKVNVSGAKEEYTTVSTVIHKTGRTELLYMF